MTRHGSVPGVALASLILSIVRQSSMLVRIDSINPATLRGKVVVIDIPPITGGPPDPPVLGLYIGTEEQVAQSEISEFTQSVLRLGLDALDR